MRAILKGGAVLGLAAALSACGHGIEQKAATGAATGLVVGGPVGAAVGAGVGVATQKAEDEGAVPKQ
jgi:hypothetical protein